MTHISEHHAEQEWKSDYRNDSRIGFLVVGHSVSIDDLLEYTHKLCKFVVSWPGYIMVVKWLNFGCLTFSSQQLLPNESLLVKWGPKETNVQVSLLSHHIQIFVKRLFLSKEHFVNIDG